MRKALKPLVFIARAGAGRVPGLPALFTDDLGVNPAEDVAARDRHLGAAIPASLTLAITPLRRLTGWNRVIQYRRMLGLFAFFYAFLHFLTYLVLDQYFALDEMIGRTSRSGRSSRWDASPSS